MSKLRYLNFFTNTCNPLLNGFQSNFLRKTLPRVAYGTTLLGFSLLLRSNILGKKCLMIENPQTTDIDENKTKKTGVQFANFTDEEYQKAVQQNYDIVILVDPLRFKEQFVVQLTRYLERFQEFQKMVQGRQIKFFMLDLPSDEESEKFQNKYKVKLEPDTILLLENKYNSGNFYKFGPQEYFGNQQYIKKYFRKVNQLNGQNLREFTQTLSQITSETVVLFAYAPQTDKDYKGLLKKFGSVSLFDQYANNPKVHFMFINDKQAAQLLGLRDSDIGGAFLMTKSSQMNEKKTSVVIEQNKLYLQKFSNLREVNIFQFIEDAAKLYQKDFIFSARSFDLGDQRYSLVLEIDENKVLKQEKDRLYDIFSHFKKDLIQKDPSLASNLQFIQVNRNSENQDQYQIYVRDEQKTVEKIKEHQITDKQEMNQLTLGQNDDQPHSYLYGFDNSRDGGINSENLLKFLQKVESGIAPEQFKSQKKPSYEQFSKKLVGKTFEQNVLQNDVDQAVFLYSKHCHACQKYGAQYELLAQEAIINGATGNNKVIQYNRMNSDRNTLDCATNYPYTPVFMVYQSNAKNTPFVYRNERFTPQLLREFIEVTTNLKLVNEQTVNNLFENYQKVPQLPKLQNIN